jgi:shikimate kinase
MLDPDDPERTVVDLLEARREAYARAELAVETDDLSPEQVAAEVQNLLEAM